MKKQTNVSRRKVRRTEFERWLRLAHACDFAKSFVKEHKGSLPRSLTVLMGLVAGGLMLREADTWLWWFGWHLWLPEDVRAPEIFHGETRDDYRLRLLDWYRSTGARFEILATRAMREQLAKRRTR